jgi:hypothetical protein
MFSLLPPQIKLIGAIVIGLGLVYSGWYAHGVYTDHKTLKLVQQAEKARKEQEASDRLLIKNLQDEKQTLQDKYIWLGKELNNAKGKLASCKSGGSVVISPIGGVLWDNIGKGLSEDSTGAVGETSTSSSVEHSIEDLYENYRVNSERCNKMRLQIENIIQWDEKTFGGKK